MATIKNTYAMKVVHPLDDKPEQKRQTEGLGPIEMTPVVKISLMMLRVYLILMTLMLLYHVAGLAGILGGQ